MANKNEEPKLIITEVVEENIGDIFDCKDLKSVLEKIKTFIEMYGEDARFSLDLGVDNYDDPYLEFNLETRRPETEEEYQARIEAEKAKLQRLLTSNRQQYEHLNESVVKYKNLSKG